MNPPASSGQGLDTSSSSRPGARARRRDEVIAAIHSMIRDRFTPGDRLPSESALAVELGVGRSTVREATRELERRGVLARRWGVGTVVTEPAVAMGLEVLESFESLADRQGWTCGTTSLTFSMGPVGVAAADRLGVPAAEVATTIDRIKTRDARPVAHMRSIVPGSVVAPGELEGDFDTSITEFFARRGVGDVDHARCGITAVSAGTRIAAALGVARSSALLRLDEVFVGPDGRVLAWNVLTFVPGTISLQLLRRP